MIMRLISTLLLAPFVLAGLAKLQQPVLPRDPHLLSARRRSAARRALGRLAGRADYAARPAERRVGGAGRASLERLDQWLHRRDQRGDGPDLVDGRGRHHDHHLSVTRAILDETNLPP